MKGLVKRCKMYACENLRAEINHFQPEGIDIEYLDFGYHRHPGKLPPVLQERLERDREYDAILLGYGLCSKAVRGVRAVHQPLVIPRVHDCIALFLGSQRLYREIFTQNPDIYFLTRGWLAEGVEPYAEYQEWCARYGEETARWMKEEMYRHYRKLCLLDTGVTGLNGYYQQAARAADFLGAEFQLRRADLRLLKKLLFGPWDEEFLVLQPGKEVRVEAFI
ncbi:MAG: DUF1638 domain-containing protein [bacterium]|nr:DUF1638 domain-containing protein [Bacillota bacterium]HHW54640.1 DUF1638 domain-containing protein [Bacillota bacterium]